VTTIRTLFDETQIAQRVNALAGEIAAAMPHEFTLVGLFKGSFVFVADLVRALDRAGAAPRVEFIGMSSYGQGKESSGQVRLVGELPTDLSGRSALLVDDILDSGRTLAFARDLLIERSAERVLTCVLVDKPVRRKVAITADFVGFTVGDVFIVGYGIDYAERYRHLPRIGAVE
jgi:hypoxanthine phosphoribosyltransferase